MDNKISVELKSAAVDSGLISFLFVTFAFSNFQEGSPVLGSVMLLISFLNARTAGKRWAMSKG